MSPVNCRMAVGGAGSLRPLPQKCWSPINQTASWRIIRFLFWPLAGGVAEVVDRPVAPMPFFFFCIPSLSLSLGSPAHTRIPAFCFAADQLYDFQFANCEFNPRPCRLGSLTGIPTSRWATFPRKRSKIPVCHRGGGVVVHILTPFGTQFDTSPRSTGLVSSQDAAPSV